MNTDSQCYVMALTYISDMIRVTFVLAPYLAIKFGLPLYVHFCLEVHFCTDVRCVVLFILSLVPCSLAHAISV